MTALNFSFKYQSELTNADWFLKSKYYKELMNTFTKTIKIDIFICCIQIATNASDLFADWPGEY